VLVPLGLFHEDHAATTDAGLAALGERRGLRGYLYADALYRGVDDLLERRIAELTDRGVTLRDVTPLATEASFEKRRAIGCYASQLRGLSTPGRPGHVDALAPERYWEIGR
jgi:hypothetical protein